MPRENGPACARRPAQRAALMARMGHDSERAAVIYQHAARSADEAITDAIDARVEADQADDEDRNPGSGGALVPAG
jgi:hypothetical protein